MVSGHPGPPHNSAPGPGAGPLYHQETDRRHGGDRATPASQQRHPHNAACPSSIIAYFVLFKAIQFLSSNMYMFEKLMIAFMLCVSRIRGI